MRPRPTSTAITRTLLFFWNNRGCKSIVWRCCSRLEAIGHACHSRTVNETLLEQVVIDAITEFDETLVKRLIAKITVFEDLFTVDFKSGLTIDIEI